ncbi:hypothetical protein TNCV_4807261 [Trichonephila clavipes]|nr:hypothetical protein TNCV_4807261 [Trichonephila clavipes]
MLGDSRAPNDKNGYRNGAKMFFQTSFGSACSIMMDIRIPRSIEENASGLLSFEILRRDLSSFISHWAFGTNNSVYDVFNLNSHIYISQILRPVAGPYLRGLGDDIVLQDNSRPHVACHALNCIDTEGFVKPACFLAISDALKTS